MNGRSWSAVLFLAVLALGAAGCKDEIAAPTQGFIAVETVGASDADVYLDDVFVGQGIQEIGPVAAGTYRVRVERECFENLDAAEKTLSVVPAEVTAARWELGAVEFGQVTFSAGDEFGGAAVSARVQQETAPGVWTDLGATTPVTLDVPCGTFRFRVASPDPTLFVDSAPISVTIDQVGEQVDAPVTMRAPRAVLGEMFTFISCAGCPDAAAELGAIHEENVGRFYVVEWHSQTPFPLFDARWRTREEFYTAVNPPKPAVAHQGGFLDTPVLLIGSAASELAAYHQRFEDYLALCGNDCPLALRVEAPDRLNPTVRVLWRGGTLPSPIRLHVVLIEHHVQPGGGNQPWFDFVPRDLYEADLAFTSPGEILVETPSFALGAGWNVAELNVVAFVQEMTGTGSGEILAVAGTADPLPQHR